MLWWSIAIHPHDGSADIPGYQAMSSTRPGYAVGVFGADGVPYPSVPAYSYTTMATNVAAPSWAAQVLDFGVAAQVPSEVQHS